MAIFLIATSIAIGTTTSIASPVLANKDNADKGLETADDNVHDHALQNDKTFHEGLCQGGHTTDALGTCDNPIISDPGNSDDHRQDK